MMEYWTDNTQIVRSNPTTDIFFLLENSLKPSSSSDASQYCQYWILQKTSNVQFLLTHPLPLRPVFIDSSSRDVMEIENLIN